MKQLNPSELAAWLADDSRAKPLLLDVREPHEFAICRIAGAENRPMQSIPASLDQLDAELPTVVICHHGMRSYQVGAFLERAGFADIYNLSGGVAAWADQVEPGMARY
ncbi:rhodanese-like domain-containing protein [Chitinimonas taiwanensis]|jgi:rhodanese-related sulfurtransferase|uniref:Rhodanese-related sulfurtransferase n=1 Tax=Chitinimonas taiwanensis DSM 18899 TaxID=1121279 RepID=A0A1K2H3P7_9NEIS|nr:rhodanese-like domain-containing protein [Chitinimonas taiwanensis]SFZ70291.1 Rhodanese-related sulfurtransferase [Chitinimonas taiwanensis DSM 18899]